MHKYAIRVQVLMTRSLDGGGGFCIYVRGWNGGKKETRDDVLVSDNIRLISYNLLCFVSMS